ncbi:pYEATS domain-containing protein [Methanocrinis sp.]|uniref:pYEATS domain-containing protein n=1 Tax=Methanocrinis sp. TaxID=3101522 RepID=UPI003D1011E1
MKSNRSICILLAFAVILSASALAVEAPSSPFEPEEEVAPDTLGGSIDGPPSGEPTATMPAAGPEPSYTPSASSGEAEADLSQGETLTRSRASSIGGSSALATIPGMPGLQAFILYNGAWSMNPSGFWPGQRTNLLLDNDRPQQLWSYEIFPDGRDEWISIGYVAEGYINGWYEAVEPGWHQLAVYGEMTGWSNVLWIYVWPGGAPATEPDIRIVTQAVDPATGRVYYSYNSAGLQIFKIKVLVTGPDKFDLRSVHYQLHPTFSPSEQTSTDPYNDFELELWTWGAFNMPITVTMKDGRVFEYDYDFSFGDLLRDAQRRGVPFVRVR